MYKYVQAYEEVSAANTKIFNFILGLNLCLLKVLLIFVKLALVIPG